MSNIFTKHPHSVGESYAEHACIALYGAARLGTSALLFVLHAFITFVPVPKPFDLDSTAQWLNSIQAKRKGVK